jgi:hypothetical protein
MEEVVGSIPTRSTNFAQLREFLPRAANLPPGVCGALIDSKDVRRGSNFRDPFVLKKTGQMGRERECVIGTRD